MNSESTAAARTAAGSATAEPGRSGPPGRRRRSAPEAAYAGSAGQRGDSRFSLASHAAAWILLGLVSAIAIFLIVQAAGAVNSDQANWLTSFTWDPDNAVKPVWGIAVFAWGTLITSLFGLLIGAPVAVGVALFITHYAPRRLSQVLGYLVDLLAAVPSVVYGLWGLLVLVPHMTGISKAVNSVLGWIPLFSFSGGSTRSMFTAGVVLAIMILPIIAAISREVMIQTPRDSIEAAYALGATRWEMVRMAVIPHSRSGISSAAVLGLGRALGETVAVAMVLSAQPKGFLTIVNHFLEPHGQTVAANIALSFGEAAKNGRGALIASGLVLFVITLAVNYLARSIANRGVVSDRRPGPIGRLFGRTGASAASTGSTIPTIPTAAAGDSFAAFTERPAAVRRPAAATASGPLARTAGSLAPISARRKITDQAARIMLILAFVAAMLPLVSILATVFANGSKRFGAAFLTHDMNNVVDSGKPTFSHGRYVENFAYAGGGVWHAILGTLEQAGLATVVAVPLGLMVAVYLVEYGRGRLATAVTFMVDVLMGLPSIVAGLFILAILLGTGQTFSGFAAACALAILMLPVVIRSSEEMLKLVPDALREASYALGIPKWRTVLRIVIPTALPGIITGVMLGVARIMGETAPVLLVAGTAAYVNANPLSGGQGSLPVFIYNAAGSNVEFMRERAWSAALTLVLIIMLLNLLARAFAWWKKPGRA